MGELNEVTRGELDDGVTDLGDSVQAEDITVLVDLDASDDVGPLELGQLSFGLIAHYGFFFFSVTIL